MCAWICDVMYLSTVYVTCLMIQLNWFFLSYQAVNPPQALAVQRASRSLGPLPVVRGGGAPAQLSLPRNLPSASPQIHSRYVQHSKTGFMLWLLVMLSWTHKMHHEALTYLSSLVNIAGLFTLSVFFALSL